MKHFFVDNFFKNVMIKWKICMAVNLWELRSDLSWKDAASSTEGMTSSAENLLHLTSFCLIVFSLLSAFLSSKQFRNNQIQLWNHWLLFNVFSLKYNWKKNWKVFIGRKKRCIDLPNGRHTSLQWCYSPFLYYWQY